MPRRSLREQKERITKATRSFSTCGMDGLYRRKTHRLGVGWSLHEHTTLKHNVTVNLVEPIPALGIRVLRSHRDGSVKKCAGLATRHHP